MSSVWISVGVFTGLWVIAAVAFWWPAPRRG